MVLAKQWQFSWKRQNKFLTISDAWGWQKFNWGGGGNESIGELYCLTRSIAKHIFMPTKHNKIAFAFFYSLRSTVSIE